MTIDHEERRTRLGGSDAPVALGLSEYKTPWELWAEKTGRLEPDKGSDATGIGKLLESPILDYAEEQLGPLKRDVLVAMPNAPLPLASTLDAITVANQVPVEAKTSGIVGPLFGEWGDPETDIVPMSYLVQVTVQMICSEAEFAYLYALLGGRGIVRYRIHRDQKLADTIVDSLDRWWDRHIIKGEEPEQTAPVPLEVAKRLRKVPDSVIHFDDSHMAAVAEWEQARELRLSAEKTEKAAQSKLLLLLGENEAATLTDGRFLTNYETTRKGYVVNESTYRTLRTRKAS